MPNKQTRSSYRAPHKQSNKTDWGEMPSGFIGWILWALPAWTWLRRGVIILGALASLSVIGITNWYLIKTKSIEVDKVALETKNLRQDYFISLWERSEDPSWKAALLSHSKPEEIPEEYWRKSYNEYNDEVKVAITTHSEAPRIWIDKCLDTQCPRIVFGAIANRLNSRKKVLEALLDSGLTEGISVLTESEFSSPNILTKCYHAPAFTAQMVDSLFSNPNTPSDILISAMELLKGEWRNSILSIAEDDSTPPKALRLLADDLNILTIREREAVARNRNTPYEVLRLLAEDSNDHVRESVASNKSTPPEILGALSENRVEGLKESVALNPSAPSEVLRLLAKGSNAGVRQSVALNLNTPSEVLRLLAKDFNDGVRLSVASNPNTPSEILKLFASNPKFPHEDPKLIEKDYYDVLKATLARNPSTPLEVLKLFAKDPLNELKGSLAVNPKTPPEVLKSFVKDDNFILRGKVALNPGTSDEILMMLAKDNDTSVKLNVISNPSVNTDVLVRLSTSSLPDVLKEVAANEKTPKEILSNLVYQASDIREALAKNPSTPIKTLKRLVSDTEEIIRNYAMHSFLRKLPDE